MDVLSATPGIDAAITKTSALEGYLKLSVAALDPEVDPAQADPISGKIFVFADNNKGKTNIKVISLENSSIAAEADADAQVSAAGGVIPLTVTTNREYNVNVNDEAQTWLSGVDPTKAPVADQLAIRAAANATGAYRVGTVTVTDSATAKVIKTYTIVQEPAADQPTDIASVRDLADDAPAFVKDAIVLAASKEGVLVVDENAAYIYVKFADNTIERGNKVSFSGVKKTDEETDIIYVDASEMSAEAYTGEIPDLPYIYFGTAANYDSCYTVLSGVLQNDGANYIVNSQPDYGPVKIEPIIGDPDLSSFVGKNVNLVGYTNGYKDSFDTNNQFTGYTGFIALGIDELSFEQHPSWNLAFTGESGSNDKFTLTVSDGCTDWYNRYGMKIYKKEILEAAGSEADFVASEAFRVADLIQSYLWYYSEPISEDAYNVTKSFNVARASQYGEFVLVAVGLEENGLPNGKYAICNYEKVDPAVPLTYADFLGTWMISGAEVVVKADVEGSSYIIENFPNTASSRCGNHNLAAIFNAQKGRLEIPDQVMGEYDDPSANNYGPLKDYFVGWYVDSANYYAYNTDEDNFGVAAILCGQPDGTLEMRAGASGDGTIDYRGYVLRWEIQTGANAGAGNLYGSRVTLPVTGIEKIVKEPAAYADFIGTWTVGTGTWTIAQKVDGSTYTVTGIPGLNGELRGKATEAEACYDAETGSFYIMEQKLNGEEFTVGTYGACDNYMCGIFTYGSSTYGNYPTNGDTPEVIFTGFFDGEGNVKLYPGSCAYGIFTALGYEWVIREGSNAGAGNKDATSSFTALPAVMVKAEAASDEYNQWLGSWSIPSKQDIWDDADENIIGQEDAVETFIIKQGVANESYFITGVGISNDYYDIVAQFDKATGNLVVKPQIVEEWNYQNVLDITEALVGVCGDNITWSSDYTLFTASLEGTTATLTPGAAPEGTFESFMFYQYYEGGGYAYDSHYALPNVLTKVATSVVPSKAAVNTKHAKVKKVNVAPKAPQLACWTMGKVQKAPEAQADNSLRK